MEVGIKYDLMKTIAIYGIIKGYRNCGENFIIETKLVSALLRGAILRIANNNKL